MDLKQEMTNIGQDIKMLRYNIRRKFKKASDLSSSLIKLVNKTCDKQTILEAEGYQSFFAANHNIFMREYPKALSQLKYSQKILSSISGFKDNIESLIYKERLVSVNNSIRLCEYNISAGGKVVYDESQFGEKIKDDIELKLEEIMKNKESGKASDSQSFEIKYQGSSLPVKNDKTRLLIEKCTEIERKIEDETDINKRVNYFLDILNNFDEITRTIKKDKQEESAQTESNLLK